MCKSLLFSFLVTIQFAVAQGDSLVYFSDRSIYYFKGSIQKIITYAHESCSEGINHEWHGSGRILKVKGENKRYVISETVYSYDPAKDQFDSIVVEDARCGKSGTWYEYDYRGNCVYTARFVNDHPVCELSFSKDTLINIETASFFYRLEEYLMINSYTFQRSAANKKLVILFPTYGHVNTWRIYNHKLDLTSEVLSSAKYFENWEDPVARWYSSDTGGESTYDFSNFPTGEYYIYYFSMGYGTYYEVKIVLTNNL